MKSVLCLVTLSLMLLSNSYPIEDQVHYFDGQPAPMNFQMFSGYLDSGNNKQAHYIFCTAQNQDSENIPLLVYVAGATAGVKTSVMWEFWEGFGPFVFDYNNLNQLQLKVNNHAWNQYNHLLVIEGLVGVGFSLNGGEKASDDKTVTEDIINTLNDFYKNYPEFAATDTWLAGGGYGGVLIPKVVNSLIQQKSTLPIKSVWLVNPLIDVNYTKTRMYDFMWGHFIYSPQIHKQWVQNKCDTDLLESSTCEELGNRIMSNLSSSNLNIMNIYTSCIKANQLKTGDGMSHFLRCIDQDRISKFLNTDSFKTAFNIKNYAPWKLYYPEYNFVHTTEGSFQEFKSVVETSDVRVFIIHGDTDLKFPVSAVRDLIYEKLLSDTFKITSDWTAFPCNGQVGGYIEDYNYGKLRVTTVRGGGHYPYIWKPFCANIAIVDWFLNKTVNWGPSKLNYQYDI